MAIEIPNGFAQVALRIDLSGDDEKMFVTFGIEATGDATTVAEAIVAETDGTLDNLMTAQYAFDGCRVTTPSVDVLVEVEQIVGTAPGEAIPQNSAYLVRKSTGLRGRENQGRFFLPGVPENKVSPTGVIDPTWTPGSQINLTAFYDAVLAITEVTDIVILHQVGGPTPTSVLGFGLQSRIATQRRRLR